MTADYLERWDGEHLRAYHGQVGAAEEYFVTKEELDAGSSSRLPVVRTSGSTAAPRATCSVSTPTASPRCYDSATSSSPSSGDHREWPAFQGGGQFVVRTAKGGETDCSALMELAEEVQRGAQSDVDIQRYKGLGEMNITCRGVDDGPHHASAPQGDPRRRAERGRDLHHPHERSRGALRVHRAARPRGHEPRRRVRRRSGSPLRAVLAELRHRREPIGSVSRSSAGSASIDPRSRASRSRPAPVTGRLGSLRPAERGTRSRRVCPVDRAAATSASAASNMDSQPPSFSGARAWAA